MAKKANARILVEQYQTLQRERVDRENGVIYGVKVCGLVSGNGRKYTPEALQNAISLYQDVSVNIDHPVKEGEPTAADRRFGQLKNVHWSDLPTPGLYADLHFLTTHPLASRVAEAAERMPSAYGLSHNAYAGDVEKGKDGEPIVKKITEVVSVDLVADPATNSGLFEGRSLGNTGMKKTTVGNVLEKACTWKFQKKVLEALKGEHASLLLTEMDEPGDAMSHEDMVASGIYEMCGKILASEELDDAGKLKGIKELLRSKGKILASEEEEPEKKKDEEPKTEAEGDDEEKEKDKKEESLKAIGIDKAVQICEQLELNASGKQIAEISKLPESSAKCLAEALAKAAISRPESKPESGSRASNLSEGKDDEPAQDVDTFVKRVTRD